MFLPFSVWFSGDNGQLVFHQAAKNAFDEMGVKKLPKVRELRAEYAKLLEEKKKTYAEYRNMAQV